MIKIILVVMVLSVALFQGAAFAVETEGEVIFRDTLYGAAIGAVLGTAVYLVDTDDFAGKVGAGVLVGSVGGLLYGLKETRSFVEIEKDNIRFAVPAPAIEKRDNSVMYSVSLLKTKF
ncbi:MAG: glycine zipper family protein [Nitrospiraceae bacterium]|nr:MAG: glycine zipper family protein [Nitrospiraceae bacterium]